MKKSEPRQPTGNQRECYRQFLESLENARREVDSWPAWKREIIQAAFESDRGKFDDKD